MKTKLRTLLGLMLALSLSACLMPTRVASFPTSTPGAVTATPSAIPTQAAPTMTATLAPAATFTPVIVMEPTQTPLPVELPTGTPAPTEAIAATATPAVPTITAWMNTNCRQGPDPSFTIVGSLDVGDTANVLGKSSPSGWWYIENPSLSGGKCWVWGTTTEVTGDTDSLPVVSPPE